MTDYKYANIKMGLKTLAANAHSMEAGILPSAAWRLVWALGSMKDAKGKILVDGLVDNGKQSLNFSEMKIGYTGDDNMTIIPAEAYCDMNVAMNENQNDDDICKVLRNHLDKNGFQDVGVWKK